MMDDEAAQWGKIYLKKKKSSAAGRGREKNSCPSMNPMSTTISSSPRYEKTCRGGAADFYASMSDDWGCWACITIRSISKDIGSCVQIHCIILRPLPLMLRPWKSQTSQLRGSWVWRRQRILTGQHNLPALHSDSTLSLANSALLEFAHFWTLFSAAPPLRTVPGKLSTVPRFFGYRELVAKFFIGSEEFCLAKLLQ